MSVSDCTLDALLDRLQYFGLADDSREIGRADRSPRFDSVGEASVSVSKVV